MIRPIRPLLASIALAGMLLVGLPGAAGAAKLRVRAGAYAHPGGGLVLNLSLKRGGRPKHGRLTVALSANRRLGRGDLILKRGLKPPGRKHRRRAILLTVPAGAHAATYRLLVCRGRRCHAASRVRVTDLPVGTIELTGKAVGHHRLSSSRAALYRVWAVLGDPRLPRAYRGDVDASDPAAMIDALAARDSMRPADRAKIARFLLPPTAWVGKGSGKRRPRRTARTRAAYAGGATISGTGGYTSCDQQATTKHWSVLTGRHVRIWWWRGHGANRKAAAGLVRAADGVIWPAFQKLMGRAPPSDAGRRCDGGDGHYDIYLLPKSVIPDTSSFRAVTLPFAPPCSGSPAFTEFNTHGGGDPPTRFELAHELFHAFQFAFEIKGDCAAEAEHRWFDEASAVWASTWLYPHEEGSHERSPDEVLRNVIPQSTCSVDTYDYGAFPFALEIQKRHGLGTVPAIYRAYADHATSLAGIDSVLPGGFAKAWRQFGRDAFNDAATGRSFAKWYGMRSRPLPPDGTACGNPDQKPFGLPKGEHGHRYAFDLEAMNSLTTSYDDMTFGPRVEQVTIRNHTVGNGRSDLQVFLHQRDGHWQIRDLSDRREASYCLADQRIDRMVLVYGDHSIEDSDAKTPRGMLPARTGPVESYETGLMVDVRDSCARFFKVNAVSGSLDYTASYTRGNPVSCSVSGAEHKTAAIDPDGHLDATDGSYEPGSFVLNVPLIWSGALDYSGSGSGCPVPPTCHAELSEPGGPIASALGEAEDAALEVQIVAPAPDLLGGCGSAFGDGYWSGDVKLISTSVPVATLTSGRPFSITWQATASGAGRSTTRKLTATVIPTTESGQPLKESKIVKGKLD